VPTTRSEASPVLRVAAAAWVIAAVVWGIPGTAGAARRQVAHVSGASADAHFSTCGPVANGDICALTIVRASNERTGSDFFEGEGPCLYIEHIVGYRFRPWSLIAISDQFGKACGTVRVTVPRSLNDASVVGSVPTQTCVNARTPTPTRTCTDSGSVAVDLSWQANGPLQTSAPTTTRYSDYSVGLPCVYHRGLLATRPAIASGSIPAFGPLGRMLPDPVTLRRSDGTWVGQNLGDCMD
jgi:hypothetical protein